MSNKRSEDERGKLAVSAQGMALRSAIKACDPSWLDSEETREVERAALRKKLEAEMAARSQNREES